MPSGSEKRMGQPARRIPKHRPGPIGGKRDENRRMRVKNLCEAGRALFLERGIERVTIDEIVSRAGVAKGSFYLYFNDKEDLVRAVFDPIRRRIEDAFDRFEGGLQEARTSEKLYEQYLMLGRVLGGAIFEAPEAIRLYLQECRGPNVGARRPVTDLAELIGRKSIDFTKIALDRGLLRPFDPRVSALSVVGAVERLLFGFFGGEDLGNPIQATEGLISLVMDGLRPK